MRERKKGFNFFNVINNRNIAIHIAIFLFYVLYFHIICESGLSADDMWNSNIQAAKYLDGFNAWEVTWNQFLVWLKMGRFFPFSNYAALLFSIVPSVTVYKSCIIGMIWLNNYICGCCLKRITKSNAIQFLYMLIFPLFVQLTPEFDSGLYCYHMLIQMVVLWCFLSLWCLLRYMEGRNVRYAIGSGCFYFLALGTYEVSFVFIFALFWVVFTMETDWKRRIRFCLPNLLVIICMGLANLGARLFLQEGTYEGITVNISLKPMMLTFLKQCATCFPVGRYICSGLKYCVPYSEVYPYTIADILSVIQVWDVLAVVLFVGVICMIKPIRIQLFEMGTKEEKTAYLNSTQGVKEAAATIEYLNGEESKNANQKEGAASKKEGIATWNRTIIGLGLIVFLFPGMLIAVSAKYQQILGWCGGHLPAYMQSVGIAIFLTGMLSFMFSRIRKQWIIKTIQYNGLVIAIIILILNQVSGRAGVEYMNGFRRYPQENIEKAAEAGFFEEIAEDDSKILFGTTSYIYDNNCTNEFYSKLTKSRIMAIPRDELVNLCIRQFGVQETYDMTVWQDKRYYAVFNMAAKKQGAIIMGYCQSTELNEAGTGLEHVWIQNPKVFVRGEDFLTIPATWTLLESGEDYRIYELDGTYDIMQEDEYYKNEAGTGVLYR